MMNVEVEAYSIPPELESHEPGPGWVLILPDEETDQTTGGILIGRDPNGPQNVSPIRTGLVVAIGPPQDKQTPRNVVAGDTTTFSDSGAVTLHIKGVPHLQVSYAQILGKSVSSEVKYILPVRTESELIVATGNGYPQPVR